MLKVRARGRERFPTMLTQRLSAGGGIAAQLSQALANFAIMALAARALEIGQFGKFGILYSIIVLGTAVSSGLVGDSLTVLDRSNSSIRASLQIYALGIGTAAALLAFGGLAVSGFVSGLEAALLGCALGLYLLEDLLRRLLMSTLNFGRIVVVDLTGMCIALVVLGSSAWSALPAGNETDSSFAGTLTLSSFLMALAVGQLGAICAAVLLLPSSERYWARGRKAYGVVFRYGCWRAMQQMLRPALLTALRLAVVAIIALAAAGELEVARLYAAPLMLAVGGFSSYMFASFARQKTVAFPVLLAKADHGVAMVVGMAVLGAGAAILLLPWAGPLITGTVPNVVAVGGWLLYAATVASVTPYGVLAAVRANAAVLFGLRLADTAISFVCAVAVMMLTSNFALIPASMALGSLMGGAAIRIIVLNPRRVARLDSEGPMPRNDGPNEGTAGAGSPAEDGRAMRPIQIGRE